MGRQILDDIDDFEEDYEENAFNIYTSFFIKKYGTGKKVFKSKKLREELASLAVKYLEDSLSAIGADIESGWSRYVLFYLNEAKKIRKS
ncbi:hypothetical protein HB912_01035 [Listeria aquatica]|uniref:Uncharacterized protein n=1 Tax=Listeria aquatica TaxID=1494960 RepID=A0A841ZHM7_9LIST|nr:hypothetical protein [Listeria aquatica]MBC1520229.1 hypothetical protein [Listeria aquatica]